MPVQIIAKIEGLKELEFALTDLAKTYGDPKFALQALRPAIRKALLPIRDAILSNVPVDTGRLKESVKLRIRRPKKIEKNNPGIGQDSTIIGIVGYEWRGGSLGINARSVEFGSITQPAQPVLRSALESHSSEIISTFAANLRISLDKKATMLNKRRR